MACYIVPAAAFLFSHGLRKKQPENQNLHWLSLLFLGGSLFGIIDHFWNNELFLISKNLANDLLLGFVITFSIVAVWAVIIIMPKLSEVIQNNWSLR